MDVRPARDRLLQLLGGALRVNHPIGETRILIDPFDERLVPLAQAIVDPVRERFRLAAETGPTLVRPTGAYSERRDQYLSSRFLDTLDSQGNPGKSFRLGITDVDLFVPGLNFVFGEARPPERVAVFSVARLDPRFYGHPANPGLLLQRAVTEATHELGHAFGLEHCARRDCVMWFSNTLEESDRKGSWFCRDCQGRLVSAHPIRRAGDRLR